MCITIKCKAIKDNSLYPFLCFLFSFISIHLSLNSIFIKHNYLQTVYSSIGNTLSFIPYLIYLRTTRNSSNKSDNLEIKPSPKHIKNKKYKSLKIDYEYNDKYEEIAYIKGYHFLFLSLIEFLQNLSLYIIAYCFSTKVSAFFWSADILSLYIFSKCFLTITIYRHHIISLCIFVIFDIYITYCIITGPNYNIWQIVCIFSNNILYSLKAVYAKYLMDYHFISHYKLCLIIGLITFFFSILSLIAITIIDEIYEVPETYIFLMDNVLTYFYTIIKENNETIIKEIIFSILYMIANGLSSIFFLITLNKLSPFHIMFIKILISIEYNIVIVIIQFNILNIINLCIYGLSIFVLFFFLEILQINCCNLNKNTKDQIQERSIEKNDTLLSNNKTIDDSSSITVSNQSGENSINSLNNNNSIN